MNRGTGSGLIGIGVVLAVVGAIVLVFGVRGNLSRDPPVQIFPDMKLQPTYHAQGENRFFADRREGQFPAHFANIA